MSGTYVGDAVIDQATDLCVAAGVRTLATHYYGADDAAHAAALLGWMNPPQDALILDAGCGIGEVALHMHQIRPDLRFTLLNINQHQLDLCPPQFDRIRGDFHDTGLPPLFDVVMFNTSICHADLGEAVVEASRLLRPGGRVFVSDVVRRSGDNTEIEATLHTRVWSMAEWVHAAHRGGLRITFAAPACDDSRFRSMLGDELFARLFTDLQPAVITLDKP